MRKVEREKSDAYAKCPMISFGIVEYVMQRLVG